MTNVQPLQPFADVLLETCSKEDAIKFAKHCYGRMVVYNTEVNRVQGNYTSVFDNLNIQLDKIKALELEIYMLKGSREYREVRNV